MSERYRVFLADPDENAIREWLAREHILAIAEPDCCGISYEFVDPAAAMYFQFRWRPSAGA